MAALKVLIVAEGPSEIGELDSSVPAGKRRRATREGYMPPMVRQFLGDDVEIVARRVMSIGRFQEKSPLAGHADRSAKALALATAFECGLVVFVKDVDCERGTKKSDIERAKRSRRCIARSKPDSPP